MLGASRVVVNVTRRFNAILKMAGLHLMRYHGLRRGAASLATAEAGIYAFNTSVPL
jgi:hypothetical protein